MQPSCKLHFQVALVLTIAYLFGTGCSARMTAENEPAPTNLALSTAIPMVDREQPAPIPTRTTPIVRATARTATATPDSNLFLNNALRSNGNCRLPCWWSIVPGQTDWVSAEAFLSPLSLQVVPFERDEYTYYTAYLAASEPMSEQLVTNDFAVWDDTVQLISALGETGSSFTPAVVLQRCV